MRQCLESVSILHVTLVPWHGRATPLCALGEERNLKIKPKERCLKKLVSLAPHKEELGKMNKSRSTAYARTRCWKPGDGGSPDSILQTHFFCRLKQQHLLFQMFTVSSAFTKVQTRRAGMHWAGVGLNVTHGLVMCKLIKWEYVCRAVSLTLESGCGKRKL